MYKSMDIIIIYSKIRFVNEMYFFGNYLYNSTYTNRA